MDSREIQISQSGWYAQRYWRQEQKTDFSHVSETVRIPGDTILGKKIKVSFDMDDLPFKHYLLLQNLTKVNNRVY